MKSNEWLYGKGVDVPPIPKEVAEERIRLLQNNLNVQIDIDYTERNNVQINDILRAIKHWEKLRDGKNL